MTAERKTNPVDVLGIGDTMVDLSTLASQLPPRGGNIWSTAVRMSPGGTTANVAANVAKLGVRSGFVGCLGDDPYGQYSLSEFEKVGVDTSGVVVRPGVFTGIVLAIIDDEGERTFIACAKGAAHSLLEVEDVQGLDFAAIPSVHSSGVCLAEEPTRSALLSALEQARRSGCTIYFDPNLRLEGNVFPDVLREGTMKAIATSHVVLVGDEEMRLLYKGKSLEEGVDLLRRAGVEIVVVKQGAQGATVYSQAGEEHCPAFQVPVVSMAGAGDSFDAGFIAARQRNASLKDALVYACAVAAVKVTRPGSRSVPGHGEVLNFLAERGQNVKMDLSQPQ